MYRRTVVTFVLVLAAINSAQNSAHADYKWIVQTKEHKEDSRGGGGEKSWRDVFFEDGYAVYDYTIRVISVRGGGSWWGSDLSKQSIGAVGSYFGVDSSRAGELAAEQVKGGSSDGPWPVIENNGELLKINGITKWEPFGGRGGNVKYEVAVCLISKNDLKRLKKGSGHRFAVMGVRSSQRPFDADRNNINSNLQKAIDIQLASGDNSRKRAYTLDLEAQQGKQGGSSQRWILVKTDEKDVYVLKNFRLWRDFANEHPPSRDMVLDYSRTGNKFQVDLEPQAGESGNSSQRWILVKIDGDEYLLKNYRLWRDHAREKAPSRDMVLDYTRTKDNKFGLELQPQVGKSGNSSQRWKRIETTDKDVYLLKNFRLWRDHEKEKPPSRDMVVDYR